MHTCQGQAAGRGQILASRARDLGLSRAQCAEMIGNERASALREHGRLATEAEDLHNVAMAKNSVQYEAAILSVQSKNEQLKKRLQEDADAPQNMELELLSGMPSSSAGF